MPANDIRNSSPQSNTLRLALLAWKSTPRGSLRGFATVRLGKSLKITDVIVLCSNGKRWANMPAKPQIDKDGNVARDDRGKIKYVPIVEWMDKESADRFSEAVIEAVEREHPGQTSGDYAP